MGGEYKSCLLILSMNDHFLPKQYSLKQICLFQIIILKLNERMSRENILMPQGSLKFSHHEYILTYETNLFEKIAEESFETLRITPICNNKQRKNILYRCRFSSLTTANFDHTLLVRVSKSVYLFV